jgi:hypothetical protein
VTTNYFYDAVTPANIPDGARACLYMDGEFKATAEQAKRFSAVRWITVEGGAAAAADAGAADFEPKNPVHDVPGRLREWAMARQVMNCRARVYSNRSDLPAAHALVGDLGCVVFWVATLDNYEWPLEELAGNIGANEKLAIPLERYWGAQFQGGMTAKFDLNVLYGQW